MGKRLGWITIGGVLLVFSVGMSRPWSYPAAAIALVPDPACDLHRGPCSLPIPGGGSVTLALEPRPVPVMAPMALQVQIEGAKARAVEVDFNGVSMNMGENRFTLASGAPGEFSGQGVLPICIRGRMEWEAKVVAQTELGVVTAPFRFETLRP